MQADVDGAAPGGGGEVAVVSGAASGMGLCTARAFAEHGWTVVGVDVDGRRLDDAARSVGDRLRPVVADVTDRGSLGAVLAAATGAGPVRACVNAAGVFPPTTLDDYDLDRFRRIFDINVLGTLELTRAVVPALRAAGGGAVVNFASVDAFDVSPGQLLYSASKSAVVSLTKSLALELAGSGVTVNAVAPGWVDTPGNRATGRMEGIEATIPLRRVAAPEEIAEWVWLVAGARRLPYMTGETTVLAGGLVMR